MSDSHTTTFKPISEARYAYPWKDVLAAYREQAKKMAAPDQPALFDDLKLDCKPPGERNAVARYIEPGLFANLKLWVPTREDDQC